MIVAWFRLFVYLSQKIKKDTEINLNPDYNPDQSWLTITATVFCMNFCAILPPGGVFSNSLPSVLLFPLSAYTGMYIHLPLRSGGVQ